MGETVSCSTCGVLRADAEPRIPNRSPVCDGDRNLIDRHLNDVANLVADLSNPEPPLVDDRQYERFGIAYFDGNRRHVFSRGMFPSDPLAPLGGVAPINSKSKAPSVSGSRERPIPIPVTVVDLKAPARQPSPSQAARDWPEDQVGYLSAATVLDQWCRSVRDELFPEHHLPPATVDEMAAWLRNRLEDVCDHHSAVAEFAEEIRNLRSALRSAAGQVEPRPEHCEGVACPRCDLRTLARMPYDTYRAQCGACGTLLTDEEFAETIKTQSLHERGIRTADEIHEILRRA
jgi:hypothetical protein